MTPERRATTVRLTLGQLAWLRSEGLRLRRTQQELIERAVWKLGAPRPADLRCWVADRIEHGEPMPPNVDEVDSAETGLTYFRNIGSGTWGVEELERPPGLLIVKGALRSDWEKLFPSVS